MDLKVKEEYKDSTKDVWKLILELDRDVDYLFLLFNLVMQKD